MFTSNSSIKVCFLSLFSCITDMLRDLHRQSIHSHFGSKMFIGEKFESRIRKQIGEWSTNAQCCEYLTQYDFNRHPVLIIGRYLLTSFNELYISSFTCFQNVRSHSLRYSNGKIQLFSSCPSKALYGSSGQSCTRKS